MFQPKESPSGGSFALPVRTSSAKHSAQDDIADEKLVRASSIIRDSRMLKFKLAEDGSAQFFGIDSLFEDTLRESLVDSLTLFTECLAMWSPGRAACQASAVASWAKSMAEILASWDNALWVLMEGLSAKGTPAIFSELNLNWCR